MTIQMARIIPTQTEIRQILRDQLPTLAERYGVTNLVDLGVNRYIDQLLRSLEML